MTNNINVQIIEPPLNNLIIETQIGSEPINVSVVSYSGTNISITHDLPVLPSDINDNVASLLVAGSGIQIDYNNNIPSITISSSGASLNSEQVQDIVSNLIQGSGYVLVNYNDSANSLIISVSGLQPSGNYANTNHSHLSSDISNFNSSVSGLLPVKNISSGSGISVVSNNADFTISVTGTFGLTSEQVDDRVNNLLKSGSYINLNYDDNLDSLTINVTGLQPSGNYSLVGHSHTISDINSLQSALDNKQPSGNYSIVGHTHLSSDITDFNSAVSGLIPASNFISISGVSGVTVSNIGTNYIVSLTDPSIQLSDITDLPSDTRTFLLTSSSNNFKALISDETGSGVLVFNNSPVFSGIPTVPTAASGTNTNQIASTSFVRTEISNLVDSAPGTLDTLNELAAALADDPNFATTVTNNLASKAALSGAIFTGSVTIPSGTGNFNSLTVNSIAVSLTGHTHTTTDITNFDSSVSGLIPIKNITAGSGIGVTSLSGDFTISVTGTFGLTGEEVDDRINSLLLAGTGITLDYNDNSNILTISTSGLQPSGNYANAVHSHLSSDITDFNSSVSGLLNVKDIVSGTGIYISSNSGIYTINSTVSGVAEAASIVTNVFNKTASTINKGSVVYINGGQGDQPTIQLAIANGETGSSKTYGIVQNNISSMSAGKVVVAGALTGFDTDQYNPTSPHGDINGTTLWLSPSVSGGITTTKPSAPNHTVSVGTVVRTHQNEGVIEVRIQNGFELQELHNVAINGVTNGQFLQYNSSSGLWMPTSSGNFTNLSVNGTGVSLAGHTHSSSNITDFNSSVSGLLPSVTGASYVNTSFSNNIYTISVSGLQPSGNYSIVGHSHTTSDITDFNSSVSGLLPVTNILGGSNIGVTQSGTVYTVAVTGSLGLTTEEVDDRVASLLVAGTGINLNYNDSGNALTINTSGLQPSGNYSIVGHNHTSNEITDFNSSVSGLLPVTNITSGSGISISSSSGNFTINAIENIINSSNLYLWANFR